MNQGVVEVINSWTSSWWQWVEHATLQGSLVALVVCALVIVGRKWPSPLRYALLLIALANFAFPPSITAPTGIIPSPAPAVSVADSSPVIPLPGSEEPILIGEALETWHTRGGKTCSLSLATIPAGATDDCREHRSNAAEVDVTWTPAILSMAAFRPRRPCKKRSRGIGDPLETLSELTEETSTSG